MSKRACVECLDWGKPRQLYKLVFLQVQVKNEGSIRGII